LIYSLIEKCWGQIERLGGLVGEGWQLASPFIANVRESERGHAREFIAYV